MLISTNMSIRSNKYPIRAISTMVLRSEEHTSELQSRGHLVCRLLLEKKNYNICNLDIVVVHIISVCISFHIVFSLFLQSLYPPRSILFPYTTLFRSRLV